MKKLRNHLNKLLVQYGWVVYLYLKLRHLKSFISDLFRKMVGKKPVLDLLELHVADQCNMNCKSCFHFSNLVKEESFADLDQYKHDLKHLSQLFDTIKNIHLMGGEPLLNPDLAQFIYETRAVFPKAKIHILTNGILCSKMTDTLIDAIKSCQVFMRVSIYKPMINKRKRVEEFFKQHGISYWVSDPYLRFAKYLNPAGVSDPKKTVTKCQASRCTFLSQGTIARCALPANIKYFNAHFQLLLEMEKDLTNIHDLALDGFTLKKKLFKPMGACRYCDKVEWIDWEQTKKLDRSDTKMTDFCVSRKCSENLSKGGEIL
jgi:organic radical activating enzyme